VSWLVVLLQEIEVVITSVLVSGFATRIWSRVNTNVLVSGLATRTLGCESFWLSCWVILLLEPELESHFSNVLVSGLATRIWSGESLRMFWWVVFLLEPEVESMRMSWWVAALLQEPEVESHYECPDEWPCYKNLTSKVITNVLVNGLATRTWSRESLRMSWWVAILQEPDVESHYKCSGKWSCY
jgi:hypothetical protein